MGCFSSRKNYGAGSVAGSIPLAVIPAGGSTLVQQRAAVASSSNAAARSPPPTNRTLYQYAPPKRDEIRLLVLTRGSREETVNVSIEHSRISDGTPFGALSYVWGDPKDVSALQVGCDSMLWVTKNLLRALKRVRATDQETVLWADAVCINQQDDEEKGHQIQLMPSIYPRASRVLCWLGDDDGTVATAFRQLERWAKAHRDKSLRLRLAGNIRTQISQPGQSAEQRALTAFFSRPWFGRAWILQEVCVSPRKSPVVLCGEHEVSWTSLYFACFTVFKTLYNEESNYAFGNAVEYVLPMLNTCWSDRDIMLLTYLILLVANREAGDVRDKFFCLLGLVGQRARDYPAPNYDWTIEHVCIACTRAMIITDKTLDILFYVSDAQKGESLPSWALKHERMKGDKGRLESLSGVETGGIPHRYHAANGRLPIVEATNNPLDPVLRLYGLRLDVVVKVEPLNDFLRGWLYRKPVSWRSILGRTRSFCEYLRLPHTYAPTGEDMVVAFLRVICGDDFYLTSHNDANFYRLEKERLYNSYLRHIRGESRRGCLRFGATRKELNQDQLLIYAAEAFQFGRAGQEIDTRLDPAFPKEWLDQIMTEGLLSVVEDKAGTRDLVVTQSGSIGLGPRFSIKGDEVCILLGASVPFILRPVQAKDGSHEVVGQAYVHGAMKGQGMRSYEMQRKERQPTGGLTRYSLV